MANAIRIQSSSAISSTPIISSSSSSSKSADGFAIPSLPISRKSAKAPISTSSPTASTTSSNAHSNSSSNSTVTASHSTTATSSSSSSASANIETSSSTLPTFPYTVPSWSAAPSSPNSFSLDIIREGVELGQIPLSSAILRIGRAPICDAVIDHPSLSRYHAVLQFDGHDRLFIIDLKSSHGTFVNGQQLSPEKYFEIRNGDLLKFGGSTRMYVVNGPDKMKDEQKTEQKEEPTQTKKEQQHKAIEEEKKQQEEGKFNGDDWMDDSSSSSAVSIDDFLIFSDSGLHYHESAAASFTAHQRSLFDRYHAKRIQLQSLLAQLEQLDSKKKRVVDWTDKQEDTQRNIRRKEEKLSEEVQQLEEQIVNEFESHVTRLQGKSNDAHENWRQKLKKRKLNSKHKKNGSDDEDDEDDETDEFFNRTIAKTSSAASSNQSSSTFSAPVASKWSDKTQELLRTTSDSSSLSSLSLLQLQSLLSRFNSLRDSLRQDLLNISMSITAEEQNNKGMATDAEEEMEILVKKVRREEKVKEKESVKAELRKLQVGYLQLQESLKEKEALQRAQSIVAQKKSFSGHSSILPAPSKSGGRGDSAAEILAHVLATGQLEANDKLFAARKKAEEEKEEARRAAEMSAKASCELDESVDESSIAMVEADGEEVVEGLKQKSLPSTLFSSSLGSSIFKGKAALSSSSLKDVAKSLDKHNLQKHIAKLQANSGLPAHSSDAAGEQHSVQVGLNVKKIYKRKEDADTEARERKRLRGENGVNDEDELRMSEGASAGRDESSADYSWQVPKNQTGDGRTDLNKKFGY